MRQVDRTDLDLGDRFKFDYMDPTTYEIVATYPNGDRYFKRPSGGWAKLAPGPEVYQL